MFIANWFQPIQQSGKYTQLYDLINSHWQRSAIGAQIGQPSSARSFIRQRDGGWIVALISRTSSRIPAVPVVRSIRNARWVTDKRGGSTWNWLRKRPLEFQYPLTRCRGSSAVDCGIRRASKTSFDRLRLCERPMRPVRFQQMADAVPLQRQDNADALTAQCCYTNALNCTGDDGFAQLAAAGWATPVPKSARYENETCNWKQECVCGLKIRFHELVLVPPLGGFWAPVSAKSRELLQLHRKPHLLGSPLM